MEEQLMMWMETQMQKCVPPSLMIQAMMREGKKSNMHKNRLMQRSAEWAMYLNQELYIYIYIYIFMYLFIILFFFLHACGHTGVSQVNL
jgi:hypothetical protein